MTNVEATERATTDRLLETLRHATGIDGLAFREAPSRLTGGYQSEMFRFRLVGLGLPADLDRDLVARIQPNPGPAVWEATIQRRVAAVGFPTPAVRLTAADGPLGRALIVMDLVDGTSPLDGLGPAALLTRLPHLVRGLPDVLATMAARLHALDPEPLAAELDALDVGVPTSTAGFLRREVDDAASLGRDDVAAAGERLLATEPRAPARAITHGDLHPFNLLVTADGPVLIDWTMARVAHPAFTLGFTHLLLGHPPMDVPRPAELLLAPVARGMAARFLTTYRRLTRGTAGEVDDVALDWHRRVHAVRILVELARLQAGATAVPAGTAGAHPWHRFEPVARATLSLPAQR